MSAMSDALDRLKAEVEANGTVIGSAVTFIEGIAAHLKEFAGVPEAVIGYADQLKAESDALAAAVAANTPQA